jgi:hypothetical protein
MLYSITVMGAMVTDMDTGTAMDMEMSIHMVVQRITMIMTTKDMIIRAMTTRVMITRVTITVKRGTTIVIKRIIWIQLQQN